MSLSPILTSAAFAPIHNVGWIRVTGSDRVRWLNGMATNNIQALKPGEGNYNFFLNAQGRIQGDANVWMLEDSILLETAADRIPALIAVLDHFIIMDDVELAPLIDRIGLLVAGPESLSIVQTLGTRNHAATSCSPDSTPTANSSLQLKQTRYAGSAVDLIRAASPVVLRFELWSDPVTIAAILAELNSTAASAASSTDLEELRILEGTPLYGTDIRNTEAAKDLPQETAQTRALHFSKGCYLGQEIVERIRSRGNVHRTFAGFVLTGELPAPGTILTSEDKPVGELTSATCIELPTGPLQLALGYIRREVLDRGATITYPGGTATPSALPFQLPESRA